MRAVLRDTVSQLRSRLIDCCLTSSINYFMHFQDKLYKGSVVFHFTAIQKKIFLWMMFNNKLFDAFSFSFSVLVPYHQTAILAWCMRSTFRKNSVEIQFTLSMMGTLFQPSSELTTLDILSL
jgi:hypothetical protein